METEQVVTERPISPQRRRLRTCIGGAAVATVASLVEQHDNIAGFELVPNIITLPVFLGGAAVAAVSGYKFIKNISFKRTKNA